MTLPDADTREELQNTASLGKNFLLEASAGTGKTTTLISRVVSLINSGTPITEIAMITFTKKATAELRHKIRQKLTEQLAEISQSKKEGSEKDKEEESKKIKAALIGLDRATIDTIHSFCKKILDESPLQAGLPYNFSVIDPVQANTEFNKRWHEDFEKILDDTGASASTSTSTSNGLNPPQLNQNLKDVFILSSSLGVEFSLNGGLYRMATEADELWGEFSDFLPKLKRAPAFVVAVIPISRFQEMMQLLKNVAGNCDSIFTGGNQKAKFQDFCSDLEVFQSEFQALSNLEKVQRIIALKHALPTTKTKKKNLASQLTTLNALLDEVRKWEEGLMRSLLIYLMEFSVKGAEKRARAGKVTFEDLLVRTHLILIDKQSGAAIRSRLHTRWQQILIDEFQDTDPLQYKIAKLIATRPGEAEPEEGSLFFVGDKKQSIYHFRGADLETFKSSRGEVANLRELSTNFRTIEPVINFINDIFVGESLLGQSDYSDLRHHREDNPSGSGPPVLLLGASQPPALSSDDKPPKIKTEDVRHLEAEDIAKAVIWILTADETWKVWDRDKEIWRAANLSDIAILVPKKTQLDIYTSALEKSKIPYRIESGSFIFEKPEIQNLMDTLRAIQNPKDTLSLARALRSPLFGCSDEDLYAFKSQFHGWDYLKENILDGHPDSSKTCKICSDPDHIVRRGLEWFKSAWQKKHNLQPSQLTELIIRERVALEISQAYEETESGFIDAADTLDLFTGKIREIAKNTDGTLDDLISHLEQEIAGKAEWAAPRKNEQNEPIPAVQIMTMHVAKGLEFPIVILANMGSGKRPNLYAELGIAPAGELFFSLSEDLSLPSVPSALNYKEKYREKEKQANIEEQKRLLYVACTRARDHLLIAAGEGVGEKDSLGRQVWAGISEAYISSKPAAVEADEPDISSKTEASNGTAPEEPDSQKYSYGEFMNEFHLRNNLPSDLPDELPDSLRIRRDGADISRQTAGLNQQTAYPAYKEWLEEKEAGLKLAESMGVFTASDIVRAAKNELENTENIEELAAEDEADSESASEFGSEWGAAAASGGWSSGRIRNKNKGIDIGNAVHYSLKDLDFRLGDDDQQLQLAELAKQYAGELDISKPEKIQKICGHILKSAPVSKAMEITRTGKGLVKKEIRFQTRLTRSSEEHDGSRFDGFVDLLIFDEAENQYTILDYKYSSSLDEKTLAERLEGYKYQGAGYAQALMEILKTAGETPEISETPETGELPKMVFVFANERGTKEQALDPTELAADIEKIKSGSFLSA